MPVWRVGYGSSIDAIGRFGALVAEGAGVTYLNDAIAVALGRTPGGAQSVARLSASCPAGGAEEIVSYLWHEIGLRGDDETYDAPENSFVGECVDRRRGIPITLAALAIGVGTEMGVGIDGIGLPGHFVVRERAAEGRYFDLFSGPEPIDEDGCRRIYTRVVARLPWSERFLDPVTPADMALRMLTNLKSIYRRNGDDHSLRTVMLLRRTFVGDGERLEFARLMRATN